MRSHDPTVEQGRFLTVLSVKHAFLLAPHLCDIIAISAKSAQYRCAVVGLLGKLLDSGIGDAFTPLLGCLRSKESHVTTKAITALMNFFENKLWRLSNQIFNASWTHIAALLNRRGKGVTSAALLSLSKLFFYNPYVQLVF